MYESDISTINGKIGHRLLEVFRCSHLMKFASLKLLQKCPGNLGTLKSAKIVIHLSFEPGSSQGDIGISSGGFFEIRFSRKLRAHTLYIYIYIYVCVYVYIYIYVYISVCVCVTFFGGGLELLLLKHSPQKKM